MDFYEISTFLSSDAESWIFLKFQRQKKSE